MSRVARGDGHAIELGGGTDIGFVTRAANWIVQPALTVEGVRVSRAAFSEAGADTLNLNVDASVLNSLTAGAGIDVRHASARTRNGLWTPTFGLRYARELMALLPQVSARLGDGASDSFDVKGLPLSRHSVTANAGLSAGINGRMTLSADYQFERGSGEQRHLLSIGLGF